MELSVKPMKVEERNYAYWQSQQLAMQTGFVGSLDLAIDNTKWGGFRKNLDTSEFQSEFKNVREVLHSSTLKDQTDYCKTHQEAIFTDHEGTALGLRVDTEQHAYLLRIDTENDNNSITYFCYKSKQLDEHIENAKQGIRFIDSSYNDKFRIADGDKILLTFGFDGEKVEKVCRFIDSAHLEVGTAGKENFYHICEFAEKMEQCKNTYEPIKAGTKTLGKMERTFFKLEELNKIKKEVSKDNKGIVNRRERSQSL